MSGETSKLGRVVVACHTRGEEQLAKELVPDMERFLVPDDHIEFMKFYARAKFGIVNRVHGAFMMASMGKPAVVIGNDSRALMINNLNLPSYFVGDVGRVGIESIIESARSRIDGYQDEIESIRQTSKAKYVSLITAALGR